MERMEMEAYLHLFLNSIPDELYCAKILGVEKSIRRGYSNCLILMNSEVQPGVSDKSMGSVIELIYSIA